MELGIARLAAIVWLAYFGLAVSGATLKSLPLSLAANAVYFVVAVVLYRYFSGGDPVVAPALLAFAALGGVMQTVGMIQSDRDVQRLALIPFGLFLAAIGVLLLRAGVAPPLLGYALVGAGLSSFVFLIPGTPTLVTGIAVALAAVSEAPLVLWLALSG